MRASRTTQNRPRRRSIPHHSTLLDLVRLLQCDQTVSDHEVVEHAIRLVNSGRVVLTGSFAGQRLRPC